MDLEVLPLVAQVHAPLSIMLATNYWQTDFAIGQNRSDLLVWLRRLGSDGDGGPAFVVSDVFHARRWTRLRLRVEGANLRIDVDSTMRFWSRCRRAPYASGVTRASHSAGNQAEAVPGRARSVRRRFAPEATPSTTCAPVRSRFQRATCTFPTASRRSLPPQGSSGRSFCSILDRLW
jgi:hypothetical protein